MDSVEKLVGENNFHDRKFKIEMLLTAPELWEVVKSEPTEEEKGKPEWKKKDDKARATICLRVTNNLLNIVRAEKTAWATWKALLQRFEHKGLANVLFLRREIFTARMAEGEPMVEYIDRVRTLADKLQAIDQAISGDLV